MLRKVSGVIAVTLAAAMLAPVSAGASHPDPAACEGTIGGQYLVGHDEGDPRVPVITEGMIIPITDEDQGPFYLDFREFMSANYIFSIWLYQETNGTAKLQRGGRSVLPDTPATSGEETCTRNRPNPDTVIF